MTRPTAAFAVALVLAARLGAAPLTLDQVDCRAATHRALKAQMAEMNEYFGEPEALVRYEREYRAEVASRSEELTPLPDVDDRLAGSRLTLFGDTHTERSSQTNTVEALRAMRAGDGPVTLVIEFIDRSFQAEVDAYLAGELDVEALRERVQYDEHWGFSWENYRLVLEGARRLGAGLLLVENHLERHELDQRDREIVAWTMAHRARHPDTRYLVAYGSYHVLGRGHLADLFAAEGLPADTVLVGEAPEVYFRALRKVRDPDLVRFVRLSDELYFIRNGTPIERERETRDTFMGYGGWREEDFRAQLPDCQSDGGRRRLFQQLHQ